MDGPYPPSTFKALASQSNWDLETGRVVRGQRYQIIKVFKDADGHQHPVGENWIFLMQTFNRLDDDLSLCVQLESGDEWRIPLLWKPDAQQKVIESFLRYIARFDD
jgi:hypothetical protein